MLDNLILSIVILGMIGSICIIVSSILDLKSINDRKIRKKPMTWKEFKDEIERKGVKDEDYIDWIDCDHLPIEITFSQNQNNLSRLITITD